MTLGAGEAVVAALRAHGVRHVFGICGSSLVEVLDAMYGLPDLTYVGLRHEQVAAHAAHGYARASGGPSGGLRPKPARPPHLPPPAGLRAAVLPPARPLRAPP